MPDLKATVLVNATARGIKASFDPSRVVRYLEKRGISTVLALPVSAEDATAKARDSADRGDDLLFAIGGDGTVRDVAAGLTGTETALAAVPGGTVNIWAREAGIPRGIRRAVDAHLAGQSIHVDLGRANDQRFLLMAGVGWDAEIASSVSHRLKSATGDLAYIAQAVRMAPALRPRPARWEAGADSAEESLAWMVLGNSRLYGGRVHITGEAAIDDGELDVVAFCPKRVTDTLRLAGKVALGRKDDSRLKRFRSPEVTIETPGLAVQLDGDYAGETPMTFSVERSALLVSVPAGPLPVLFGREHTDRRKP